MSEGEKVELKVAKDKWRNDMGNGEAFQIYGDAAAWHLVSPQFKNGTTHWFCDPENFEYATVSLLIFTYLDNGDQRIGKLKNIYKSCLTEQLARCWKCVLKYHESRHNFVAILRKFNLDENRIKAFLNILSSFDISRVEELIFRTGSTNSTVDASDGLITLAEAFLILDLIGVESDRRLENQLVQQISKNLDSIVALSGNYLFPGLIYLSFSEHPAAQSASEALLYSKAYQPMSNTFLGKGQSRALLNVFSNKASTIKENDFSWFLLSRLTEYFHLDEDTLEILYKVTLEVKSCSIGPGFFLWVSNISLRLQRLPGKELIGQMFKTIDTSIEHGLKPSNIPESAHQHPLYSQLGDETWQSWIDGFQKVVITAPETQYNLECVKCFIDWGLKLSTDNRIALGTLNILTASLGLALKTQTSISFVDLALGMRLFNLLTERADSLAETIRVILCTDRYNVSISATRSLVQFTVLALLSNSHDFPVDADINRSKKLSWELICSDKKLMESHESLAQAMIIGGSFAPYLDQRCATYKSISEFYKTMSILYTRDELLKIFDDTHAETALLLACLGQDTDLVETAKNTFARLYADEESNFDLAVSRFFERKPGIAVAITVKISEIALAFGKFQILPGLVKLLKLSFDVLYDNDEGVIDDVIQKLNAASNPILELWNVTWKIMTFSFSNLRQWSKSSALPISLLREYISDSLELCLTLLSYFTRVEATMPAAADGLNRGNELTEEPVKTLESMVPLLKLRDESQLDSSFRIYKGLIELINKYAVKVPLSLVDYFKALARSQTLLTSDKYAELLAITGAFSNEEMSNLIRTLESASTKECMPSADMTLRTTSGHPMNTVATQLRISESNRNDAGRQRTMDSFFTKVSKLPVEGHSRLGAHGVTPSAPKELSAIEQIRLQLASQQGNHYGSVTRKLPQVPVEIHPARPAGFNRRKQDEPSSERANQRSQHGLTMHHTLSDPSSRTGEEVSDEDEDEDDEEVGVLVALGKKTRNINNLSRIAPGLASRSLRAPTLTESEQGVRRMMARMSVSPAELHKVVLSWDYFANSPHPTGFIKQTASVPSVFKDVEEYTKVMEPLLHLEAWQSIQRAREENDGIVLKLEIGKRVNTDDFIDVYASMEIRESSGCAVGESDLVLIAYDQSPSGTNTPRIQKEMLHCLAIVREGSLKTRRGQRYTDLQLRTYHPGELSAFIAQGRKFYMQRICSLITVEREYTALKALPYYELKDLVLQGKANLPTDRIKTERDGDNNSKLEGLNSSQTQAIETALTKQGFNLIQGPPGTGKTKTILGIIAKYFSGASSSHKRLLVCAPSNAAVDEIVLRLKFGIAMGSGQKFSPKIVRLGRKEVINPEVRDFSLEMLVEKSMSSIASAPDEELKSKLTMLTTERTELEEKLKRREDERLDEDAILRLHDELELRNRQIQEYSKLLSQQRRQLKEERIRKETEYKRLQSEYLSNAQVICCTLSGAAHSMLFSLQLTFPTVIIDEAAQSVELSALIPLKYGCRQCIMVGDPHQLPPTVLSQEAARLKYEQSMFVRFYERAPECMTLLDTQFRMHPMISKFPSHEFYRGKLKDGKDMALKTARPWHKDPILSPFRFIEVSHGTEDRPGTMSWRNRAEAAVVVDLISYLMSSYPNIDFSGKIGVIAPYKAQQSYISRLIRTRFGAEVAAKIDVATVDGYQGQEKEIIIMSCVRAQKDKDGIGFLADVRRMNVAFTRAQASLWIVGNKESLVKNKVWARLIDYAQYIGMFSKFQNRDKDLQHAIKLMSPRLELAIKHAWLKSVPFILNKSTGQLSEEDIKIHDKHSLISETGSDKTPGRSSTQIVSKQNLNRSESQVKREHTNSKSSAGKCDFKAPPEPDFKEYDTKMYGEDTMNYAVHTFHGKSCHAVSSGTSTTSNKIRRQSDTDGLNCNKSNSLELGQNEVGFSNENSNLGMSTEDTHTLLEPRYASGHNTHKFDHKRPICHYDGVENSHSPKRLHRCTSKGSERGSSSLRKKEGPGRHSRLLDSPCETPQEGYRNNNDKKEVVGEPSDRKKGLSQLTQGAHAVKASKQRSFDPTARAGHERRRKPQLFVPKKRKLEHSKR